jgi:hypothetical protein
MGRLRHDDPWMMGARVARSTCPLHETLKTILTEYPTAKNGPLARRDDRADRKYLLRPQCDRYDRRAVRVRGGVQIEHSRAREAFMSATIINLIIQLIAGAVGGNAAGAASKELAWARLATRLLAQSEVSVVANSLVRLFL